MLLLQDEAKSRQAEVLGKMSFSTSLAEAHDCDLVIEAIVERMDVKLDFYKNLSGCVGCRVTSVYMTDLG